MMPSDVKLIFTIIVPILLLVVFAYFGGAIIIPTLVIGGICAALTGHYLTAMFCTLSLAFSLFYRFEKRRSK